MNTEIPEYTADDFVNSSAPYSFIASFAKDPFTQRQILSKLKAVAASEGVRDFVALWKAYQTSLKRKNDELIENATDYPDQPLELLSGKYYCDAMGVKVKDAFGGEQVVCAHPILPLRRLVNVDDGGERLEIAFRKGNRWRTLIADKATLASSSGILSLASQGVYVNADNAKALSTFLFDLEAWNYDAIPEVQSVGRLGWVGDAFAPYVENLTFDGEVNFKHIFGAVRSDGSREEWINAMKAVRAEKSPVRIALAASFASAILQPCGLLPFFVHFWGGSGTGKTVALMIAASVWANPKMGEYIITFNSTDVGQEMTASFLNSLPMCIDELQIQASAGVRDFDRMIYKLTEGIGKTRGAKSGGLRQTSTWKNCMITTGEFPLINANSMGGATVRVVECECEGKLYSDLVGLCNIINNNYGFAGREFIEYLQADGNADKVNEMQKEIYRELLKYNSTEKQALSVSAILAADQIATELFFNDGNALTVEDAANILNKKDDIDVNARALEYIYEMVARNVIHFRADAEELKTEVWGKTEVGNIYIIKSVFDREMANAGYNSTAFLSWAKRKGIILCEADKRTKKARISGKLINCVVLQNNFGQNEPVEIGELESELPF